MERVVTLTLTIEFKMDDRFLFFFLTRTKLNWM